MKIYRSNHQGSEIYPYQEGEKIDYDQWNLFLLQKDQGDKSLTSGEIQELIHKIGYKHIASKKIYIYTPELLLQERGMATEQTIMIKLGDDCIISEKGEISRCLPLEVENLQLLKRMQTGDFCILGAYDAETLGRKSLNEEIIQYNKSKRKLHHLPLLAAGVFLLLNLGLVFYEHSLSKMTDNIASVRVTSVADEYQSILQATKNVDVEMTESMKIFEQVDFDKIRLQGSAAILSFQDKEMKAVIQELKKIDQISDIKITNIHEEKSSSLIIIEVAL